MTGRSILPNISRTGIAAVLVFCVLMGCSREETAFLHMPEVISWQRFFFAPDAAAKYDGPMEYSCMPGPPALPEDSACSVVCNEPGSICLAVDTGYLTEKGKVMRGGPDSSVSLYYPQDRSMCRFLTIGTAGGVHGAAWVSDRAFVVYGLAEGDGFVWKVDLDAGDVRKYKIPEKSRKPEADEQAYFAGMKTASASVD